MAKQYAAAALLFVALAVAATWPLTRNLTRAVADAGDPYINTWILDWDWWATLHQPLSLFHANVFHPAKYALAFSENLYGIAILLFPFRAAGVTPLAAHNIAVLAGFAFSGFAAFLLGRKLTGSFSAGLAAGAFYALVPFRFTHLSHVQHVWGGWLPLLLFALLCYAEKPSPRRAAWFAAVFVMNGLTNIHYLFFGAFAIGVTAAFVVPRRAWRDLAIATGIALVLLAPFLYPYAAAAKLYGLQRTYDETYRYSAIPSDWFRTDVHEPERRLFPGTLPIVLAGLSLLLLRREWPKISVALLWVAIGFAGSLGMNFVFHEFLFGGVPGFRAVRAPARWAVIAYVGISILIAIAAAAIPRRARWIVATALAVALWQAPIRWYLAVPDAPPVYRWLAKGGGPIVELPLDDELAEYVYYLRSTTHRRPIVNGKAWTPVRRELSEAWAKAGIGDEFVDTLKRVGVEYVVVHADLIRTRGPEIREWLRRELDRGRLTYERDFGNDWVFSSGGGDAAGTAGGTPAFRSAGVSPAVPQASRLRPRHLEVMLQGENRCSGIFLSSPAWGERVRGKLIVAGWTPPGVGSVDVYFDNRATRRRIRVAQKNGCGWFFHVFDSRPAGVREKTDIQLERNGNTSEDRWFEWR